MTAHLIQLSTDVLSWAAKRAGSSLEEIAVKVSRRAEAVLEGRLTLSQAEKYAQLTNIPLGFLFLKEAPAKRPVPLPDFRNVQDKEPLGTEFFDVYDDVIYKQEWFRDYLGGIGATPLAFVGKHQANASPRALAAAIFQDLKLDVATMRKANTPEALYAYLSQSAERAGVLVFKNGVVGNNTRRGLPVSQFRGFAIVDPYCPVVFVNGADAKAAWAFTLLHELAHIWVGESAVTDSAPQTNHPLEVLSNATAAEILVPAEEFKIRWNALNGSVQEKLESLRLVFKVSTLVIARRALDEGFTDRGVYASIYEAARRSGSASSGGDFYATLGARNGKRFADTVAQLAYSGELGLRQAGRLLNTTPSNVINYHERRALPA
jgi:Zn-dependent peptidase ImmA (M78 family)